MNKIFLLLLLAVSANAHAAQTVTAQVSGMVCAFCAQGIEKKARDLAATEDVYVNLQQKMVAIQVKDGQTLSAETVRTLVRDAGYDVTAIATVDEPVATIRARMEQQ